MPCLVTFWSHRPLHFYLSKKYKWTLLPFHSIFYKSNNILEFIHFPYLYSSTSHILSQNTTIIILVYEKTLESLFLARKLAYRIQQILYQAVLRESKPILKGTLDTQKQDLDKDHYFFLKVYKNNRSNIWCWTASICVLPQNLRHNLCNIVSRAWNTLFLYLQ